MKYFICEYRKVGSELRFIGKVAGLGRNKGNWDCEHSRRTAYKYAKQLRDSRIDNSLRYFVETL